MLRRTLVRTRLARQHHHSRRSISTDNPQPSRLDRLNRRLPAFLHKHTHALRNAPVTHITAFLVLHELTAIVPLFGLAGLFHYTHWLPSWFAEGAFVLSGVERFGAYFRRKGWIRGEEAVEAEREVREAQLAEEDGGGMRKRDRAWVVGEGGVRLVVEFATAYAVTKMLIVPRVVLSVWATPWFAERTVVPLVRVLKRGFGRKKSGEKGGVPKVGSPKE